MKLKWIKDEDYYTSEGGRFEIAPLYCGRTRPQSHRLIDKKTGRKRMTLLGVRHAKEMAEVWADERP